MFEIIDFGIDWGLYSIKSDHMVCGSFGFVVREAIAIYNVPISEVEIALEELIKNNHNVAHFGYMRRFLFTQFKEVSNEQIG